MQPANSSAISNPVVAHRGAWKNNHLPENSIASLQAAIASGYAGSEFDVWMTADDSLVINHDASYNGHVIESTNYSTLTTYPLSNGEKIPTLRKYISAGLQHNKGTALIVEIKPSGISRERGKNTAIKAVALIKELGAQQMVQYISFDYDILKQIQAEDPASFTQYLEGNKSPEQLRTDGIKGADYHFSVYKAHPGWIENAKRNNIRLNAWTVNEQEDIKWLLENKFDYITTNEPELALRLYRSFK